MYWDTHIAILISGNVNLINLAQNLQCDKNSKKLVENIFCQPIIYQDKGYLDMDKFCIFCGNKPQNKNKEHVIPQWLSKHTDRFHTICEMSETTTTAKIPFCALTFPACTACNEKFGKLEAAVKPILLDLMESKPLNAEQISLLMDWFDKIRVGLWLSELTLSKQVDKINPKFHIADRMGQKDRMLIIDKFKNIGEGLAFAGTNSPVFIEAPSVFALVVNDFVFINASEYGLVSNKLGFPQYSKMKLTNDRDAQMMDVSKGRNKTTHPVVSDFQASPTRTIIYQPMFRGIPDFENTKVFNTPYVVNHSLDFSNGIGGIFVQRGDNQIKYLSGNQTISLAPRAKEAPEIDATLQDTFKLQNFVLTSRLDIDSRSKADSLFWRALTLKNNIMFAKGMENMYSK